MILKFLMVYYHNIPDDFKSIKTIASYKGKLKDGIIAAAAGYAENALVMSVPLINSINLHSILHLYNSFISLLLCTYITF